jgi:hypothetical protein
MELIKRNAIAVILLCAAFLFSSCATETLVIKKNYDFTKIQRVAVLAFKDATYTQSEGTMVSQLFLKYLLSAGYNVIEREELDALLKERNLTLSNTLDPETVKVFKLSGIDAIVTGTITQAVPERDFYENGNPRFIAAQVGITCRMISVETGEILWAGADTYDGMNEQTAFDYLVGTMVHQLVTSINNSITNQQKLAK